MAGSIVPRCPGYGAMRHKKSFADWFVEALSADEDITYNLPDLRAYSRDLCMTSPLAAGAVKSVTDGVIGSGLMCHPHIDRQFLRMSDEQAAEWEKEVEREWISYSESTLCDASRTMNFYQLQRLVYLSSMASGDCFVAMPYIQTPGGFYRLKAFVIEGDRICDPANKYMSELLDIKKDIREGIEIGEYGEPVAYFLSRIHPGDLHAKDLTKETWSRIPAFGSSGRRNILHIYDIDRPGQRRGVPLLAPVMESLKQLERYSSSELMAAVISSYFTVFLKKDDPASGFLGPSSGANAKGAQEAKEQEEFDPDSIRMGNGAVVSLPKGADISIANPSRPNALFEGFFNAQCKLIGSAVRIPGEILLAQFQNNYSASRAAQLEAERTFRIRRESFISQFVKPFYEEWLLEAVSTGRISAPGALQDPLVMQAYAHIDVTCDSMGSLDPVKDVQAAVVRIQAGLSTRQKELSRLSGDRAEDIAAELHKEQEMYGDVLQAVPAQNGGNTEEEEKEQNKEGKENADPDPKE